MAIKQVSSIEQGAIVVLSLPGVKISMVFVVESMRETYISMEWSGEKNDVTVILLSHPVPSCSDV